MTPRWDRLASVLGYLALAAQGLRPAADVATLTNDPDSGRWENSRQLHTRSHQYGTPAVSTDHGHRARRTIKAALASAWIEFAGAAQVAQLRRAVTKKGKKTVENKLHWATSPARKTNHWSGPETRPA